MKIMKAKEGQLNLLRSMIEDLDTEFDYGSMKFTRLEDLSIKQASNLISLNKDLYYLCLDEGQCTPRQYNVLKHIAGDRLKTPRYLIGHIEAQNFINKYRKIANKKCK